MTLDNKKFNLILGLVIAYGVGVNVLTCALLNSVEFTNTMTIVTCVVAFVLGIGGIFVAQSNKPSMSFLGYNMLVIPFGVMLSTTVRLYEPHIVLEAFVITFLIMLLMITVSSMFPDVFKNMGVVLFTVLCGLIVAYLVFYLLGINTLVLSWISAGLFSLYIGYDWVMAQSGPKTLDAAIDAALGIYLDIVNLFLDLLRILGEADD